MPPSRRPTSGKMVGPKLGCSELSGGTGRGRGQGEEPTNKAALVCSGKKEDRSKIFCAIVVPGKHKPINKTQRREGPGRDCPKAPGKKGCYAKITEIPKLFLHHQRLTFNSIFPLTEVPANKKEVPSRWMLRMRSNELL